MDAGAMPTTLGKVLVPGPRAGTGSLDMWLEPEGGPESPALRASYGVFGRFPSACRTCSRSDAGSPSLRMT